MHSTATENGLETGQGSGRWRRWWCGNFTLAMTGSLLLFAALPPLAWGWLGWVAPVPWLLIIRSPRIAGRRPYWKLWLAGFCFWFLALHWLRLPHPATSLGWVALALYLGLYLPAFVGLGRQAVHRLHVPFVIAAPIVWTGLELARAHLLSGFLMASLAHTQVDCIPLLQISDLAGEYAVGFVVMLVASAVALMVPIDHGTAWHARGLSVAVAVLVLAGSYGYGTWRVGQKMDRSGPRIGLIQGNSLATWKHDSKKRDRIIREYWLLSMQAVSLANRMGRPLDLIVWPETMFRIGLLEYSKAYAKSPWAADWNGRLPEVAAVGPESIANLVQTVKTPVLLGIDRMVLDLNPDGKEHRRETNAAVLADRSGALVGCYDKVHRVMFGEYIPFADRLPFLSRLSPVTCAIAAGEGPVALVSEGITYAPNICYESVLPHVIRRQVAELTAGGRRPDLLVNLTNDAWYWGSSELDMHLACGIFRAVEMRTPLVIAANGGISAHIDSCGRIVEQSDRQTTAVIVADVTFDRRLSLYSRYGDWFALLCVILCAIVAGHGLWVTWWEKNSLPGITKALAENESARQ